MMLDALKESPTANEFTEIVAKQQSKHRFRTSGQQIHTLCAWDEILLLQNHPPFSVYIVNLLNWKVALVVRSFVYFVRDDCFIFISYCCIMYNHCTCTFPLASFYCYYYFSKFFVWFGSNLIDSPYDHVCVGSSVVLYLFVVKRFFFVQSSLVRFNHFSIRNRALNIRNT